MKHNLTLVLNLLFVLAFLPSLAQNQTNEELKKNLLKDIFENPDRVIVDTQKLIDQNTDQHVVAGYYIIMSDAYMSKRDYTSALKTLENADKIIPNDNSLKTQFNTIKLKNKLASLYFQMSMYEKAISQIENYMPIFDGLPKVDSITLVKGSTSALKGLIYREKLGCEIAIPYFEEALEIYKNIDTKAAKINSSIVYYNYAKCLLQAGNSETAIKFHTLSYNLGSQVGKGSLQAYPLKGLANVYFYKGDTFKALEYLAKAEDISKDVGDRILRKGIYDDFSEIYLKLGDKKNFNIYNSKANIERELVRKSQLNYITSSLNTVLLTEEENLKESKKQFDVKFYTTIFIFIVLIISILIILLKIKNRIKKINISI